MKPKQKTIRGKELLNQISKVSTRGGKGEYFQYEIADILNFLAIVIAENSRKGYSTTLKGIGTFTPKKGYPLKSKSNLSGVEFEVVTKNSLSLKIDSLMKNTLNSGDES